MKMTSHLTSAFLLLLLFLSSRTAVAVCTYVNPGSPDYGKEISALPQLFPVKLTAVFIPIIQLGFDPNTNQFENGYNPNSGTVFTVPAELDFVRCSRGTVISIEKHNSNLGGIKPGGVNNVFAWQISTANNDIGISATVAGGYEGSSITINNGMLSNIRPSIEMVRYPRVGKPVTGKLNAGLYAKLLADGVVVMEYHIANDVNFVATGCDIAAIDSTVPIGTFRPSDFKNNGNRVGDALVRLTANCPIAGYIAEGYFSGTSLQDGVYELDNEPNSASGVGVAIVMGPNMAEPNGTKMINNQKRDLTKQLLSGVSILEFRAGYVQTGNNITAGVANVTVEFNVDYK